MKKILTLLFIFLLSCSSLFSQVITFDVLKEIANEVNNSVCPVMVDEETRFDRCDALQDKDNLIIQYSYTMVKYTLNLNDDIVTLKSNMEKYLIDGVKNTESLKIFRDNNVIFQYVYYDNKHEFVFNVKVTPLKYKNIY